MTHRHVHGGREHHPRLVTHRRRRRRRALGNPAREPDGKRDRGALHHRLRRQDVVGPVPRT